MGALDVGDTVAVSVGSRVSSDSEGHVCDEYSYVACHLVLTNPCTLVCVFVYVCMYARAHACVSMFLCGNGYECV